jgi:hypothetical protein
VGQDFLHVLRHRDWAAAEVYDGREVFLQANQVFRGRIRPSMCVVDLAEQTRAVDCDFQISPRASIGIGNVLAGAAPAVYLDRTAS